MMMTSTDEQAKNNQPMTTNLQLTTDTSSKTPTNNDTKASISQHITTLQQLDNEYSNLLTTESYIEKYLTQLQQQEKTLRLAFEQSSTSIKEQREKEAKRKDDEAVARLEEALMMDGDGSNISSSSDDDDNGCSV